MKFLGVKQKKNKQQITVSFQKYVCVYLKIGMYQYSES